MPASVFCIFQEMQVLKKESLEHVLIDGIINISASCNHISSSIAAVFSGCSSAIILAIYNLIK